MKRSIVILLVIISIFVASCSAQPPQVTVTSEVTVTLPTATQTPEPSATPTSVYTPTPAQQNIDIGGNLSVELGAKVDGGTLIDKFIANSELSPEDQAKEIRQTDYTIVGYERESLQWVRTDHGNVILIRKDDPTVVVAEWKRTKNAGGTTEVVWSWDQMIDPAIGESVLFNTARTWEMMANGLPLDNDSRSTFVHTIFNNEVKEFAKEKGLIHIVLLME